MEEETLKHLRLLAVLVAMMIFATACNGGGESPGADETDPAATDPAATDDANGDTAVCAPGEESGTGEAPDELIIGFVPSREADALVETIQPVADHLSDALGIPVTGEVTSDYTGLVTAMESDQAHIGAFGPFSLLQACQRADAEIILQSERFGSATYHTQFMTNDPDTYCTDEPVGVEVETDVGPVEVLYCNGTDRPAGEIVEGPRALDQVSLIPEGTPFSFVEQASASGYVFPATILNNQGIDYEEGIDPIFAGAHDASAIAVCDGTATVGVSFDDARIDAIEATPEGGCDIAAEVVVFALGPEIPNDGWAVAGYLPQELKDDITQALLDYAASEEGQEVLSSIYNIDNLVPADLEAFSIVQDAAEELGIESD